MTALDECISRAPITLVYIGSETELVDHFEAASQTYELDKVNVEFAQTGRQALEKGLVATSPKVVYGLVRFMIQQGWNLEQKLTMTAAFAAAGLELADDIRDKELENGGNISILHPHTQTHFD